MRLPDGSAPDDSWISAQGWGSEPIAGSESLPGRFALPGLVDTAEATLERYAHEGVGMVRDAGGMPSVVLRLPSVAGRPFVMAAGRHLAPAGMYFAAVHDPVEPEDLVSVALAEIAAGARWVKLVADFSRLGAAAVRPEPTYGLDVVRGLVAAAHGAGARVAAHVTTTLVADLVPLGIDSVEHGPGLDRDTVEEMARRGTAWTPTLCAVLSASPPDEERLRRVAERRERLHELLPLAIRLGVPVLTGSDVVGSIPREIALLIELGVDPTAALCAATTTATMYYGADAVRAPASVITFDSDPRNHPEVLAHPAAIVIGGARLR
ncbi:MAG TPA: amidohydrolase family protein [Candidatus Dormibacteraeota bacterium]